MVQSIYRSSVFGKSSPIHSIRSYRRKLGEMLQKSQSIQIILDADLMDATIDTIGFLTKWERDYFAGNRVLISEMQISLILKILDNLEDIIETSVKKEREFYERNYY